MTALPYESPYETIPPAPSTRLVAAVTLVLAVLIGATAVIGPAAPIALALAALAIAVAYQRPVVAGILVTSLCPALSGVQRGLGVGFKPSELLLLLATAVVVLRRPVWGQGLGRADAAIGVYAVLGAAFAAVHTAAGTSTVGSFLQYGMQPTLLFLTFWTASRSVRDERDLAVVLRWVLGVSTVPAALAVLQAFDAPGVRALLIRLTAGPSLATPGEHGLARATGPFPIWHSLSAYLVPVVVVGFVLLLTRENRVLSRPLLLGVMVLDLAALVLALTATVLIWAVAAVLVVAVLQRRLGQAVRLLVVAAGLAGVVFSGPISERFQEQSVRTTVSQNASRSILPQTVAYRLAVWNRDYVPLLERAVPFGVANALPESVVFKHAENQYITLTLRGGILLLLGAAGFLSVLGAGLLRTARRRDELTGRVAGALLGVLVFLPLAAMIWPYLTNAGFPQVFLALTGAVTGAQLTRGTRSSSVVPHVPTSRTTP